MNRANEKRMYRVLCLAWVLLISACSTYRITTSNTSPDSIDRLLIFSPKSTITIIGDDNKPYVDVENTLTRAAFIDRAIDSLLPIKIVTHRFQLTESQAEIIDKEVLTVMQTIERNNTMKGIKVPDKILRLMEASQCNYTLGMVATGYDRSPSSYRKARLKESIRSLGDKYTFKPFKSFSHFNCLLFNRKANNVTMYFRDFREIDPMDQDKVTSQVKKMVQVYFN